MASVSHEIRWEKGTRRSAGARLTLTPRRGEPHVITLEPVLRFQMRGLGYLDPEWGHGVWKGEHAVGGDSWVLDEVDPMDPADVRQVLMCSGKVYFDLLETRRSRELHNTAIVRVEQLYPFPRADVARLLGRYTEASTVRWVQEEPWNQGAWFYMHPHLKHCLLPNQTLDCATRPESASPAVYQKSLDHLLHFHLRYQS